MTDVLIANDDKGLTAAATQVTTNVLANDTLNGGPVVVGDLDGPPQIYTQPQKGSTSVVAATGEIHYTPTPGTAGKDSYEYKIELAPAPPEPPTELPLLMELIDEEDLVIGGPRHGVLVLSNGTSITLQSTTVTIPAVGGEAQLFFPGAEAAFSTLRLTGPALKKVLDWGSLHPSVKGIQFSDAVNLVEVPPTLPTQIETMENMFQRALLFNQDISGWDVSRVSSLAHTFSNATTFNQPLGSWNTLNVLSTKQTFQGAAAFNQNLNGWNMSQNKNTDFMFDEASAFNGGIGGWDVSNIESMRGMFMGAHSFDQDLSLWRPEKVTDMDFIFFHATGFNQDLSGWCVPLVASTPHDYDFGATAWTLPNSRPVWGTCP